MWRDESYRGVYDGPYTPPGGPSGFQEGARLALVVIASVALSIGGLFFVASLLSTAWGW